MSDGISSHAWLETHQKRSLADGPFPTSAPSQSEDFSRKTLPVPIYFIGARQPVCDQFPRARADVLLENLVNGSVCTTYERENRHGRTQVGIEERPILVAGRPPPAKSSAGMPGISHHQPSKTTTSPGIWGKVYSKRTTGSRSRRLKAIAPAVDLYRTSDVHSRESPFLMKHACRH